MLTNNCRGLLRSLFCAEGRRTPIEVTIITGAKYVLSGASADFFYLQRYVKLDDTSGEGVFLGSGTTPAKKTDYCLEAPLTVGKLTYTCDRGVDENGKAYALYTIAYTNTTTEAVKIGEVGMYAYASLWKNTSGHLLIDRTLLDSPITLAAGESCAIRYRLTNQFTV